MVRFLMPVMLLFTSFAAGAAMHDYDVDDRGVLIAIAQAPAETRNFINPYEADQKAIDAGRKLFRQHCSECHGANALGRGRAVNLRAPAVQSATAGELAWLLRNGNLARGMPSWSGLTEQRRWQIVSYLKSLGSAPSSSP